jgi:hypothetical protein
MGKDIPGANERGMLLAFDSEYPGGFQFQFSCCIKIYLDILLFYCTLWQNYPHIQVEERIIPQLDLFMPNTIKSKPPISLGVANLCTVLQETALHIKISSSCTTYTC